MKNNLTRFNKYLYKYWKLQAAVILLGLIMLPLSLLNPYLTKLIIDKAYANKDLRLFLILAFIGGGIFIFNSLINHLSSYLSERLRRNVHFDITKDLFSYLEHLSLSFFNDRATGEHIYMIYNDVGSVSGFLCSFIPQMISLLPRCLLTFIIVFHLNWKLALFALLLIPVNYIPSFFFARWLKKISLFAIEKSQKIFKRLNESLSHIKLVKALGREIYELKRLDEDFKEKIDFELKTARLSSLSELSNSILNKVIYGLIALYGGYQVIKGSMTLGSLTAVMIYFNQFLWLTGSISRFYESFVVNSISFQRLTKVFDVKSEITDKESAVEYKFSQGRIEFREVYFKYKKDNPVLKGISFSINPTSKIALVGSSGRGKTTLVNLILRLYEPEQGAIRFDGLDIRDIKLRSIRSQIGIALQETLLWDDSVASNILYGTEKADADREDAITAAKLSGAHDFIMNLSNQYDTVIGEMACKISEGQKQRIAIARAIVKKPKILILDEAMSSLDSETEDKIVDNILSEFESSTIIMVSHRLSTVKRMDLVYFLTGPSNIEIGTHEELLRKSPRYKELFASQIEGIPEKETIAEII